MSLADCIARPAIERVIQRKACFELHEIAAVHARQAKRRGEQTSRLWCEVETRSIRSANNNGEAIQCFAVQAEFLDHDIERAQFAAMAPEDAFNVERRGLEPVRRIRDLGWCYEQEHGGRIDEATDQPRACNAVDLRPGARDP